MRTMSVSGLNRRRVQSLVAHEMVKSQQSNKLIMFFLKFAPEVVAQVIR